MLEAVKVALDPTPRQERALLSHAGAARFAYNAALAHVKSQIEAGKRPDWSYYSLRRWWNAGKDGLAPWWRENSKEAYNAGLESLGRALKNYSASKAGERKGRRAGFPRFKTKDGAAPSYSYTTGSFGPIDGDPKALKLPRVGRVHCFEDVARRVGDAKVTRMTISRRAGRWYASLSVERPGGVPAPVRGRPSVGVDLGVRKLATLSDGTVVPNPHAYKARLSGLKRAQRELSRKRKGSARRERARLKVARANARIADSRSDATHKLTAGLVRTYGLVAIEDLNVSGMMRNHHLAQAVADASFGEFRRQLEYKAERNGVQVAVVECFFPSSKTCSRCGAVKAKLPLSEAHVPMRGMRTDHRQGFERGNQHTRRRECPGDAKRARRVLRRGARPRGR